LTEISRIFTESQRHSLIQIYSESSQGADRFFDDVLKALCRPTLPWDEIFDGFRFAENVVGLTKFIFKMAQLFHEDGLICFELADVMKAWTRVGNNR